MEKEEIFDVVKAKTLMILPEVSPDDVTMATRLKDLGANSVDRVEVVNYTMEELKMVIPRVAFSEVENLGDLVKVFYEHRKNEAS